MKIITKLSFLLVAFVALTSCATKEVRVAGELPKQWWNMEVDSLENIYRDDAKGADSRVKLFVGISDEPTNATESDAIEDATRKVSVEISRYLAVLVTSISQSAQFNEYVEQRVKESDMGDEESVNIINDIKNETNKFSATISTTQFSTMKLIGKHTEAVEGKNKFKGWVCASMTDDILKQTQELQEAAFKNILDLSPEYKQVIADINTAITKNIKDNVSEKTDF